MSIRNLAKQVLARYQRSPIVGVSGFSSLADETVKQSSHRVENKGLSCFNRNETTDALMKHEEANQTPRKTENFLERGTVASYGGEVSPLWASAYANLSMGAGDVFEHLRVQAVDDAKEFLEQWGRQAEALGWKPEWVFGHTPDYPFMSGLAWCLQGGTVLAIGSHTAKIRYPNTAIYTCRLTSHDIKEFGCFWEVAETGK